MNESVTENPETQLSDSHRLSSVAVDSASDSVIMFDEDGVILFVNRATEKMFGYSQAELVGKSLVMLMPEYVAGLARCVSPRARSTSPEAVELIGLDQSGTEIPIEISFGEFTEKGRRFFTGSARDISERRWLEQRLNLQLQIARLLAASTSITEAAPALLQAIGENLGRELGQIWAVDSAMDVLCCLAAWSLPSIEATEFEEASRRRTFVRGLGFPGRVWAAGTREWVADIAPESNFPRAPLAIRAGLRSALGLPIMVGHEVLAVMEFFSRGNQPPDQSQLENVEIVCEQIGQFIQLKRADEERARNYGHEQRARREVETAIDRMRQVQTVTDVALAHLSLDELLAELLVRVQEAMNVDTVVILLLETEGDSLLAWAARGLEEEVELGVRIPVGAGFAGRIAATKSPLRIDDIETADVVNPLLRQKGIQALLGVPLLVEGRIIGVMHTGRFSKNPFTEGDTRLLQLVADRIALAIENTRLFDEERTARREAEAASRAKDEFLTTISHELRTPLTPIIGWIHMIRNGILPDKETVHGLSVIEKNAQALKRLINDLLDMSAILSGKMRMEELPVSLEQVVREAVETVRPLAAARNIEIIVTFRDCLDATVSGDRARLVQVFWNLLNNAEKFSPADGKIEVEVAATEQETIVRVRDAGQGIEADFIPFIFERFRQADGSKTRPHGGLGLGLALVKSFVEAHNGTVRAESAGADQGSCFTVTLPRLRPQIEVANDQPLQLEPSIHVLVVEDDRDTLEMLRAALEARGFRVTASQSAVEALEAALGHAVDLMVSDIAMPEVDGLHLIRQLRAMAGYQDIPAIALSGYASQEDAKTAIAAGFNAHVAKPVDATELAMIINSLLEKTSNKS